MPALFRDSCKFGRSRKTRIFYRRGSHVHLQNKAAKVFARSIALSRTVAEWTRQVRLFASKSSDFGMGDRGSGEVAHWCAAPREMGASLTRGGDLRRIGAGEQKAKYSRLLPLAVHPWPPVPLLPYALKSNRICAGGWLRLLRIAIAMRSIWFPLVCRRWMHWWEACRAGR